MVMLESDADNVKRLSDECREAFTSFHVNLAFKKQWPETVAFTDIHAQLEKIDTAVTDLQRVAAGTAG
jgi:hypothetical protein